jgi:hypothetical protein
MKIPAPVAELSASDFVNLLVRVRAGEPDASAQLVNEFEPILRREIRMAMEDRRLSRAFDSVDVSQSVFASFFCRARSGQFEVANIAQLSQLLAVMARNKLASRARHEKCQKRDMRRTTSIDSQLAEARSPFFDPAESVSRTEQLEFARARLSSEVWQLLELRSNGLTWEEVAENVGGTSQARRVQVMRALRTLASSLQVTDSTTVDSAASA